MVGELEEDEEDEEDQPTGWQHPPFVNPYSRSGGHHVGSNRAKALISECGFPGLSLPLDLSQAGI